MVEANGVLLLLWCFGVAAAAVATGIGIIFYFVVGCFFLCKTF